MEVDNLLDVSSEAHIKSSVHTLSVQAMAFYRCQVVQVNVRNCC